MNYNVIAEVLRKLESTTKRLEMTEILTNFFKNIRKEELGEAVLLLLGRAFPEYSEEVIGVANKLMIKAISRASGLNEKELIKSWKETGDLGVTAEKALSNKKQVTLMSKELTSEKVLSNLKAISKVSGKGSVDKKLALISELLTQARPEEAKYITRTILGTLRVGVGTGTIRDSLAQAFNCNKDLIERAYNLIADYSEVAVTCAKQGNKGLERIGLSFSKPAKVMLYQKAESFKEGFERVGKPCAIEYKYDGLRLQVHKKGQDVQLFTRRLDNVTRMFPEVVEAVKLGVKEDCIIEGEGVGYNPRLKSYKPFQEISKRIKRKYDITKLAKETPVVLYLFDVFDYKGINCLTKPYKERWAILKKLVKEVSWKIELAKQLITSNEKEAEAFYKQALAKDQEGVMMKNLKAPYKPGSRVGYGIKIKPIMEPLDLTITHAYFGIGRRSKWFGSFDIACKKDDELLGIGKIGTGFSDKQLAQLNKMIKESMMHKDVEGMKVKVGTSIIIEVGYEEIQKSPTYSSGFALRFPRLLRFRPDKDEPDNIERIREIFKSQGKK